MTTIPLPITPTELVRHRYPASGRLSVQERQRAALSTVDGTLGQGEWMDRRDSEFVEFTQTRAAALRRTAFLLCGDWQRAEDVVQTALVKLYVSWPRVRRDGNVDGYMRRIISRTAIDEFRKANRRREILTNTLPELAWPAADSDNVNNVVDVGRILDQLPARQRAVIVLRYWEDLSITETADTLGISEGTVKSQTAKALTSMRKLLGPELIAFEELS